MAEAVVEPDSATGPRWASSSILRAMSWDDLIKRIENAAKDLAILTVRTRVLKSGDDTAPPVAYVKTKVDQITGDIDTDFSESAFTLDYGDALRSYHETQREAGAAILARNVEVITNLLKLARNERDDSSGGAPPTDGNQ